MQVAAVLNQGPVQIPAGLESQAKHHLFICQSGGMKALDSLIAKARVEALSHALVVVGEDTVPSIESACCCCEEQAATEISAALVQAPLETAVYVAGTPAFREAVQNQARTLGFTDEQIHAYASGSVLRRVFCTHCYTTHEYDRNQRVVCNNCKRPLSVRERFSRYLGAYVGIQKEARLAGETLSQANTN